jgi:hypothetical protein
MNEKLNTESIRQLLNRSSTRLDPSTLERLRDARMQALAHYDALNTAPIFVLRGALTGTGHLSSSHRSHYYWAFAVLLAAFLFSGALYWQHVTELDNSEVDIAILTDDLPIDAYVD